MTTTDDIIKYVQHTPENTNPSVLGGLLSDLQEGKSIQSDWNQNDETAVDYVKNRPFYTGDPVETVFVEESTLPFVEQDNLYVADFEFESESTFVPTAGETYRVSWDGTVYECTCVYFQDLLLIGNISLLSDIAPDIAPEDPKASDTGEPFLMDIQPDVIFIMTLSTSASHTFSISGFVGGEVVKIDKKYLPIASETEPGIISVGNMSKGILRQVKEEYFSVTQSQILGYYGGAATIQKYADKNNSYGIFSPGKFGGAVLSCYNYVNKYITSVLSGSASIECWKISQGFPVMEQLWGISKDGVIISSSTPDSTKKFKITVDDSGTLSATEVTA